MIKSRSAVGGETELSIVIPAHNSAPVLRDTLERWSEYLRGRSAEVIVVENGSSDTTWAIAVSFTRLPCRYVVLRSDRGLGNALRAGIAASVGRRVLLSADDLPFGFDDLTGDERLEHAPIMTIGSKAHRDSQAHRGAVRRSLSRGYRLIRHVVLGSRVGDSQGTIIADGEWIRRVAPQCTDSGFLFTTELTYVAEIQGYEVVEVPVSLVAESPTKHTAIRVRDVWRMGAGVFILRARRHVYSSAGLISIPLLGEAVVPAAKPQASRFAVSTK